MDTTSDCAVANSNMLGGYGLLDTGSYTEQTFSLRGIPHTEVALSLEYVAIDSWDFLEGIDYALVLVDGKEVYRTVFDATYPRSRWCGSAFIDIGPQPVSAKLAHAADAVTVRVSSTLDGAPSDESYGVDDVVLLIR